MMLVLALMHEIRTFLTIAARHLKAPLKSTFFGEPLSDLDPYIRRSASTFTTFGHLEYGGVYLRDALPLEADLSEEWIGDAAWGMVGPMRYDEIAHVLIPHFFEQIYPNGSSWDHEQDIAGLSDLLTRASIEHRLTEWALEIKRF